MLFKDRQRQLFAQLAAKYTNPILVTQLEKLLNVGKSAVYARLSGERELLASELILVAKKYHLSLDRLRDSEKTVVFEFSKPFHFEYTAPTFLETIAKDLRVAASLGINRMQYSASELPIFYYFYFPEITYFKLYQWSRMVWRVPFVMDQKFSVNNVNLLGGDDVFELATEMQRLFFTLESVEIWATNILQNTLQQILFCAKINRFAEPETPQLLFQQLRKIVQKMEKMTENGYRNKENQTKNSTFQAFHNVTANANNTVILLAENDPKITYLATDNPNFLKSTEPAFCDYSTAAFQNLQSCSDQISMASEASRTEFFQHIYVQIDLAEAKLLAE
jgi:hypothetical protein